MDILCDTHVLLWAAYEPSRLPPRTRRHLLDGGNALAFSVASLWEVAIKAALGRHGLSADVGRLRGGLLASGYRELPIEATHTLELPKLPALHGDPFDRILLCQARVEGMALLTADQELARYGDPVLFD